MTAPVVVLLALVVVSLAFAARYARLEGQRAREVAWLRRRLAREDEDGTSDYAARREAARLLREDAIRDAARGLGGSAKVSLRDAREIEEGGDPC